MNYIEKNLVPYFQPIISIDSGEIYGYEILGRYIKDSGAESLGGFFSDKSVPCSEQLEVDRIIRSKGLEEFGENSVDGQYIFINMRLDWLAEYSKNPEDMPTIKWAEKYGIDYKNIVIELLENDFNDSYEKYILPLSYYKSLGIRIAIDDYGAKSSSIQRIADVCPDIVKIDMALVHKSEQSYQYRNYLKHITNFCDNLGIEVVYEGIENKEQLLNCMNSQGRFYQGFLLSKPLPQIKDAFFSKNEFKSCSYKVIIDAQLSKDKSEKLKCALDEITDYCIAQKVFEFDRNALDDFFVSLADGMPSYVQRIYLCNKYGFQISSNIEYGEESIELVDNFNKNWAWRGYFKNALRMITDSHPSFITKAYRDISTKEHIYTYARKLDSQTYLFADVCRNEI